MKPSMSTFPVIAPRRCIFTSHVPLRGCAIWNGFTTTFVSSTCCSMARRCHEKVCIQPDLSRPGNGLVFKDQDAARYAA